MAAMIGVFGGTFDPPHLAHSILADQSAEQLGLERVLWAVVGQPPHKPDDGLTPAETRAAMVAAAIAGDDRFELSRVDLDRRGPHYTADTMELLGERYPGQGMVYLMGSDSLSELPTWHESERFLAGCAAIAVLRRPGAAHDLSALEASMPGLPEKLRFVEAPLIEISGTDIRERARQSRSIRYLVMPAVSKYIHSHQLYA